MEGEVGRRSPSATTRRRRRPPTGFVRPWSVDTRPRKSAGPLLPRRRRPSRSRRTTRRSHPRRATPRRSLRLRFVLPPDTTPALRSLLRVDDRGDPPSGQSLRACARLPPGRIDNRGVSRGPPAGAGHRRSNREVSRRGGANRRLRRRRFLRGRYPARIFGSTRRSIR